MRAIVLDASGAVVRIDEPALSVSGTQPEVELKELTGGGFPEAIVTFHDRVPSTSVFSWHDGKLAFLSRDADHEEFTTLILPNFVDLDGDNVMEAIDVTLDMSVTDDVRPVFWLYRFNGERYVDGPRILYYEHDQSSLPTEPCEADFCSESSSAKLTIVNGVHGRSRASGIRVVVNGAELVSPSQFNRNVDRLIVPLSVVKSNSVSIDRSCDPAGSVLVLITEDE